MAKDPTELTEERWKKIEPLLPKFRRSPRGGRRMIETMHGIIQSHF